MKPQLTIAVIGAIEEEANLKEAKTVSTVVEFTLAVVWNVYPTILKRYERVIFPLFIKPLSQ